MFLTANNEMKWRKMGIAALVTGALVVLGIMWFDKPLYLFLRQFDCRLWHWFGYAFDAKVWIFGALIAVLVFCIKKCVKTDCSFLKCANRLNIGAFIHNFLINIKNNNAFLILCSVVGAGVVARVLKIFIGRQRPVFFESLELTGFFPPQLKWEFNSMPSGHTTVSFAALVMIGMLAPKYKPLTWGLAIVIGVSRIAVGAHWPSDVIFGAFIGMVVADVVKWYLLKK